MYYNIVIDPIQLNYENRFMIMDLLDSKGFIDVVYHEILDNDIHRIEYKAEETEDPTYLSLSLNQNGDYLFFIGKAGPYIIPKFYFNSLFNPKPDSGNKKEN